MARTYRMKCPACGNVQNLNGSGPCAKCGAPLYVEQPAAIAVYRMGNFVGMANGFGLYLNEQPFGAIGSYHSMDWFTKIFLCIVMWLGRLEILTGLILLTPGFWREYIMSRRLGRRKTGYMKFRN